MGQPQREPERIELASVGPRRLLLAVLAMGVVEAVLITAIVDPGLFGISKADWIVWFVAIVLGIVLVLLIFAVPAMLRRPTLTFDTNGVVWSARRQHVVVSWHELVGVGVSVGRPFAYLDLYPASAETTAHRPDLLIFRTVAPPPQLENGAVLGPYRYRFRFQPDANRELVAAAVQRHRPDVWLGEYDDR